MRRMQFNLFVCKMPVRIHSLPAPTVLTHLIEITRGRPA